MPGTAAIVRSLLSRGYQVTTDNDLMVGVPEQAVEGSHWRPKPSAFIADNFLFCKSAFLSPLSGKFTNDH